MNPNCTCSLIHGNFCIPSRDSSGVVQFFPPNLLSLCCFYQPIPFPECVFMLQALSHLTRQALLSSLTVKETEAQSSQWREVTQLASNRVKAVSVTQNLELFIVCCVWFLRVGYVCWTQFCIVSDLLTKCMCHPWFKELVKKPFRIL